MTYSGSRAVVIQSDSKLTASKTIPVSLIEESFKMHIQLVWCKHQQIELHWNSGSWRPLALPGITSLMVKKWRSLGQGQATKDGECGEVGGVAIFQKVWKFFTSVLTTGITTPFILEECRYVKIHNFDIPNII